MRITALQAARGRNQGGADPIKETGGAEVRAPKRKRPLLRRIGVPDGIDLRAVATRADYVGSPEHKDVPSFAGAPSPRVDASLCDRGLLTKLALVKEWLRQGIRRGAVSEHWEGEFPRYVWYKDGGTVYEARLVNRELGSYKGYALEEAEWPPLIETYYAD